MFTKKMLLHRCIPKATTKNSLNNRLLVCQGRQEKSSCLVFVHKLKCIIVV